MSSARVLVNELTLTSCLAVMPRCPAESGVRADIAEPPLGASSGPAHRNKILGTCRAITP
jgi:hypothetical protein